MYFKFKHLLFTIAFLLLTSVQVVAQENLLIKGVIIDKELNSRIALAEIRNMRSGFAVGSNDMGFFTLRAAIGDTLMVTKRNFNDQQTVVLNAQDLIIFLNKGNTLNEVTVIGKSKQANLEAVRKDFRNKGSFYAGKPPILSFIFSPLTALYELFGKTPQQARRFNRMYENEIEGSFVDQFFNKSLINQQTGLTGKALDDFLINYRPSFEQTRNWASYDALKWINDSYKKYTDTAANGLK